MKKQFLHYWLALNAGAIQAGAHALKAYISVAVAHAAVDSIPALSLKQIGFVFGIAALLSILDYLDSHPLPVDDAPGKAASSEQRDSTLKLSIPAPAMAAQPIAAP